MSDGWESTKETVSEGWENTKEAVSTGWENTKDKFNNEATYLSNKANELNESLGSTVRNNTEYAKNSINNETTYLTNEVYQLNKSLGDTVRNNTQYAKESINNEADYWVNETKELNDSLGNIVKNNTQYSSNQFDNVIESFNKLSKDPINNVGKKINPGGDILSVEYEQGELLTKKINKYEPFNHDKQEITSKNNFGEHFSKAMSSQDDSRIVDGFISLGTHSSFDKNQQIIEPKLMASFNQGLNTLGVNYKYDDKQSIYDNTNNAILKIRDTLVSRRYYGLTQERGIGAKLAMYLPVGINVNVDYHSGNRWTNYGVKPESYEVVNAGSTVGAQKFHYGYDLKNKQEVEEHPSFSKNNSIWYSYNPNNPIADKVPNGFLNSQNQQDKTFTIGASAYLPPTFIGGSDEYTFNVSNITEDLLNIHPYEDKVQRIRRYISNHNLE